SSAQISTRPLVLRTEPAGETGVHGKPSFGLLGWETGVHGKPSPGLLGWETPALQPTPVLNAAEPHLGRWSGLKTACASRIFLI
ncbi:MAG TPA: hypothetical protein VGA61_11515, partial [Anaerolineae bacterium]